MAEAVGLTATCTWNVTSGCDLPNAIQTDITHEDLFYKPPLDDILREDRAILLTNSNSAITPCELEFRIVPRFKISSVHLLTSAPKIELFIGEEKEYTETVYGLLITDGEDDNNDDINEGDSVIASTTVTSDAIDNAQDIHKDKEMTLRSYRYDIEVVKSGVIDITLKLITPSNEVCIFGLLVLIAPNPNGITTLLPPAATINLGNVQAMLSGSTQKLSPSAEKCKLFIEAFNKNATIAGTTIGGGNSIALLEQMKHMMAAQVPPPLSSARQPAETTSTITIEQRLQQLEMTVLARLDALEAQQAAKFDAIIKLLGAKIL